MRSFHPDFNPAVLFPARRSGIGSNGHLSADTEDISHFDASRTQLRPFAGEVKALGITSRAVGIADEDKFYRLIPLLLKNR